MRNSIVIIALILIPFQTFSWGQTGHRATGEVAEHFLKRKAAKAISKILNGESLAMSAVWMDEIRSDDLYDYTHAWHWVTVPNGKTYAETDKNPDGDLVEAIKRITAALKKGDISEKEEREYLKMLVHLIGDIHQPCHVGTGEDRGGNAVKLKWFGDYSNLHKIWDSEIINSKQLSYTELAEAAINKGSKQEFKQWRNSTVDDWYREAMSFRNQVYDFKDNERLGYEYMYKNWDTIQVQILKAGVRMAEVLNDIYG